MVRLHEILHEDWIVHGRTWTNPGFHAVALHRIGRWARKLPFPIRPMLRAFHHVCYVLVRNVYGIELPVSTELGRRVKISHQSGIVVSGEAIIGDECHLRQNTTIGAIGSRRPSQGRRKPTLGRGVYVGAGAVIVGGITIGDGARIGANATVMADVPAGATAYAQPARIMNPGLSAPDPLRGE